MPTKAVVRLCRATLLCLITLCRGLAAASIDSQHSAAPHTPQNSLLRRNATAAVPLFISPIMLYNQSGQRYQDGTAPRVARYFEEAVRSVRHSDSTVEVYLIVNFLPHPEDWDLLARLRVQVLSQTHTRGSGIVTRCPCEIRMHATDGEEVADFGIRFNSNLKELESLIGNPKRAGGRALLPEGAPRPG